MTSASRHPDQLLAQLQARVFSDVGAPGGAGERILDAHPIGIRGATLVVLATSSMFAAAILVVTRGGFPLERDGLLVVTKRLPATWETLLTPFHEHLNLVPIAIWDRIAAVFGTQSPTPFPRPAACRPRSFWQRVRQRCSPDGSAPSTRSPSVCRSGCSEAPRTTISRRGSCCSPSHCSPASSPFGLRSIATVRFLRQEPSSSSLLIGVMSSNVTLFIILAMWLWFGTRVVGGKFSRPPLPSPCTPCGLSRTGCVAWVPMATCPHTGPSCGSCPTP